MDCAARVGVVAMAIALVFPAATATGQQATVSTPYHSAGDSFFENLGTSWGFQSKGVGVQFGAPVMAAPPFGRFNPGAGAHLGFGFRRNGASGYFNANISQGSQRNLVSQTPGVTVTHGMPGYVAAVTATPFVLSYVPVVGGYTGACPVFFAMPMAGPVMPPTSSGVGADAVRDALGRSAARVGADASGEFGVVEPPVAPEVVPAPQPMPAPAPPVGHGVGAGLVLKDDGALQAADAAHRLAHARQRTAVQDVPSVKEAKRLRAAEDAAQQTEARAYFERGLNAEEAGRLGAAKAYYQMAARRASGELHTEVERRLDAVKRALDAPQTF